MPDIRTYEGVKELERKLDEAAADGTLTADMIAQAIDSTDSAGFETIPYSIGISWIMRNPRAFMTTVGDPYAFFCEHLDLFNIDRVLYSEELLVALPNEQRLDIVRMILMRHTPSNNDWVEPCLNVGISQEELAEMVLEKLRQTEVDNTSGTIDFVRYDFLDHGAGRVETNVSGRDLRFTDEHTLWSILNNGDLFWAMCTCAEKAPNKFFQAWRGEYTLARKLEARLTSRRLAEVLCLAARNLQSLEGVSIDELNRLSVDEQLQLARRLNGGSLDLVVHLALKLGYQNGGRELCEEFSDRFVKDDSNRYNHCTSNFQRFYKLLEEASDKLMAYHIYNRLLDRLHAEGWQLAGPVTRQRVPDRKTGGTRVEAQVCSGDGKTTYLQYMWQRNYYPRDGEWVLFNVDAARVLKPGRLMVVEYRPAHYVPSR